MMQRSGQAKRRAQGSEGPEILHCNSLMVCDISLIYLLAKAIKAYNTKS